MKLIDDWREKVNKLWSVRIAVFTALLASGDQILSALGDVLPPVVYALLAAGVVIARIVYQPKLHCDDDPRPAP